MIYSVATQNFPGKGIVGLCFCVAAAIIILMPHEYSVMKHGDRYEDLGDSADEG